VSCVNIALLLPQLGFLLNFYLYNEQIISSFAALFQPNWPSSDGTADWCSQAEIFYNTLAALISERKITMPWKDEDIATPELIQEYLKEFKEGIDSNPQLLLSDQDRLKVQSSLLATEKFCLEMAAKRHHPLYMHDLILMAVGFYGGYLSALDLQSRDIKPNTRN
jgi:hypothetical protein